MFTLRLPVSLSGRGCRRQRRSVGFKGSHLDTGPESHHVHDLHLRVHAHLEEAPLSRLWEGLHLELKKNPYLSDPVLIVSLMCLPGGVSGLLR